MSEGIVQTKESVIGVLVLGALVAHELKNGFQFPGDLVALFAAIQADEVKKAKLEAAVADIQKVPAELGDLSVSEIVELVGAVVAELPALIEALKKSA
jgi:hypothetical protein